MSFIKRHRRTAFFAALLVCAGLFLGLEVKSYVAGDDASDAMQRIEHSFLLITNEYVEPVDAEELAEAAIGGMLKTLDPHSVFITAERMKDVREDFNASFEGVGIYFEFISGPADRDTIAVVNALPGGPSAQAGLRSGDRIVSINHASAVGFTQDDVQNTLKGPEGTTVVVGVMRPGHPDTLSFNITRGEIPLVTLDAAYMVDGRTGFIRINRFARTTYTEFSNALERLKAQGMERLILDLRDNAGGFMSMAVKVSDAFLSDGQVVVTAKSRHDDFSHVSRATDAGGFEEGPLIVLVDENSASASEIVAGALQDHDRALVMGRRTFGKGLVQKQYRLNDGSALRLTISRFYTPTGRLIQTPWGDGDREAYYDNKRERHLEEIGMTREEIVADVPDSLIYHTDAGRVVAGGGGILPDILVAPDSLSNYMQTVVSEGLLSDFARSWLDRHHAWRSRMNSARSDYVNTFSVGDEMLAAFADYAEARKAELPAASPANKRLLATLLKGHVARRMFDRSAWYPIFHHADPMLEEAMESWKSARALAGVYADLAH